MCFHGFVSGIYRSTDECTRAAPRQGEVKALQELPTDVRTYLVLLSYYSHFLPNLSTTLASPYKLLQCNEQRKPIPAQDHTFERSKKMYYEKCSSKVTEVGCVTNMAAALQYSALSKAKQTNIPRNINAQLNNISGQKQIHHILQQDLKACIGSCLNQ